MLNQKVTVTFEPLGRKVKVTTGKNVFNVARENGVLIRSECGGKGICGKCKIIVRNPEAVGKLTNAEEKLLTKGEIHSGTRLACLTTVKKDVVLTIPEESRIATRKIQMFGLERKIKSDPNVKKFYLNLVKPTLEDAKPDLERCLMEIEKQSGLDRDHLNIDYQVLKGLPRTLREANWKLTATVWNKKQIIALERGSTTEKVYGLAIDVGTSKIVVHLVDLETGNVLAAGAIENPQMMYGEDIISRISCVAEDDKRLRTLQKMVVEGTNEAIIHACNDANVRTKEIYEAVFVGNTAMHHLFFGLQPKYVSLSPYTPVLSRTMYVKAEDLALEINPNAMICSLPVVAGFVGPDAVADVLATGIHEKEETSLLLDIGTNTEVFLGSKTLMHACSCASGPAFEGVHIKHGAKAVDGAIEKVSIDSESLKVEYETINDVPPIGICGTGIIDALAEMFRCRIINSQGRFSKNLQYSRLKKIEGESCFVLVPKHESGTGREIVITQKDINEVQLAKAAIFAGCSILMSRMKLSAQDIDRVFIAGAFGTHMNPESAKILGIVPDVETKKIEFVGNTAIVGAKMALVSMETREKARDVINKTSYVELAADSSFTSEFSKALFIPHKEVDRFPLVKKLLEKV